MTDVDHLQFAFNDLKLANGEDVLSTTDIRKANGRVCLSDAVTFICQITRHRATHKIQEIRRNNVEIEEHLLIQYRFENDTSKNGQIMVDPLGFVAFFNRVNHPNVTEFKKLNDRICTAYRLRQAQQFEADNRSRQLSPFSTASSSSTEIVAAQQQIMSMMCEVKESNTHLQKQNSMLINIVQKLENKYDDAVAAISDLQKKTNASNEQIQNVLARQISVEQPGCDLSYIYQQFCRQANITDTNTQTKQECVKILKDAARFINGQIRIQNNRYLFPSSQMEQYHRVLALYFYHKHRYNITNLTCVKFEAKYTNWNCILDGSYLREEFNHNTIHNYFGINR